MGAARDKIIHEAKSAALVTVYFMFCFAMMALLLKLFLVQHNVEISALARVVIGALLIGKVVVVLDNTRLGNRFENHRVIIDVIYRSLVYTLIVMFALFLEQLFHAYRETGGLTEAWQHLIAHRVDGKTAAIALLVGLTFLTWNVLQAINRRFGAGTIRKTLLGKAGSFSDNAG